MFCSADSFFTFAQAIEGEIIELIDLSFNTLPSSAGALEMLQKFKRIASTEAINNYLLRKFNDTLSQKCKEVLFYYNLEEELVAISYIKTLKLKNMHERF